MIALLLVLAPGPVFAVVVKSALAGGRRAGFWTDVGVTASNVVQVTTAALGVGAPDPERLAEIYRRHDGEIVP